jgi:hypothetical protein
MSYLDNQFMLANSNARRLSLSMIGCVLVVDLIWFPFSALSLSIGNLAVLIVIAGVFLLAGRIQRRYEFSAVTKHLAVELYILVLFGVVGFIFSYLVIESGWTIRDDLFVTIDNALGFDWRTYTSFILRNDLLRLSSLVLYVMSPVLVGFALFWFCLKGNFNRASEIVAMVILGGILCVVISGIVPSTGASSYFPLDSNFYRGYKVIFDDTYGSEFSQLRDGAGVKVSLLHPLALIAFPSYHACLSLVVMLVFWGTGVIGSIIFALSLVSLLSLPVQGGHHLSDVLGGLLTGAVAYWLVRQHEEARGHR